MNDVRNFLIDVPDSMLVDLRERLARTRFGPRLGDGWTAGTDPDYLTEFVTAWVDDFDWRATQERVNELPQKMVSAGGTDIHVVHVPAQPDPGGLPPIPLVLTHGWPSSFFEFLPIVGPLSDPARYGGDPADAFDVIIPSLPGFGFSTRLPDGPTEPS